SGSQRGLRDVDDQVRHLGFARQLPQHLLQLLFHLRQLQLQRFEVGGASLLGLELRPQVRFLTLKTLEFRGLVADEQPPRQADDEQSHEHAEAELEFTRPGAGVVEVQFFQRHFSLAHGAVPPVAGVAGAAGADVAGGVVPAGAAVPSGAGASGLPSPFRSLGAFGLASNTLNVKAYGKPGSPALASMIDRSGLVIQPELSKVRM